VGRGRRLRSGGCLGRISAKIVSMEGDFISSTACSLSKPRPSRAFWAAMLRPPAPFASPGAGTMKTPRRSGHLLGGDGCVPYFHRREFVEKNSRKSSCGRGEQCCTDVLGQGAHSPSIKHHLKVARPRNTSGAGGSHAALLTPCQRQSAFATNP
jgi:hypothetical protein